MSLGYAASGPVDAPGVVLLHGWSCSRGQWAYQIPALSARYRTIAIDLPGHGESVACRVPPTIEAFSDVVAAFIDGELGGVPVVLIAHSLGSAIAVEVARRLNGRIDQILALDGLVYLDVYERQGEPAIHQFLVPFTQSYDESALTYLESLVLAKDRLGRRELARTYSYLGQEFGLALYRSLLQWDMAACIAAITVPITVLCASAMLEPRVCQRYGKRLDIIPIAKVGHFLHMERPEVVTPLLQGLLECWSNRVGRSPHADVKGDG